MNLFKSFGISGSGMTAERLRLDLISNNIANINTTRTAGGGPYRRDMPVFAQHLAWSRQGLESKGVRVAAVLKDPAPPRVVHQPGHPDADATGHVAFPNVDISREFVDMISALRAYEANAAALESAKQMIQRAIDLGRS